MKTSPHKFSQLLPILSIIFIPLCTQACDTTAEFSFNNNEFSSITPTTILPKHCNADCTTPNCLTLNFSIQTTSTSKFTPSKDSLLQTNKENFIIQNPWLFEISATGQDITCTTNNDCTPPFTCHSLEQMNLNNFYYQPQSYCTLALELTPNENPTFNTIFEANTDYKLNAKNASGLSLALAINNANTLDGSYKSDLPDKTLATDPDQIRKSALLDFYDKLYDSRNTTLKNRLESAIFFMNGYGYTGVFDALKTFNPSKSEITNFIINKYPPPSGASPFWEAMDLAITTLNEKSRANYAKTIFAFTDSPPTQKSDAKDAFEAKLNASPQIQTNILHLDNNNIENKTPNGPSIELYKTATKNCATYYYTQTPSALPHLARNLATNLDSYWSLPLSFNPTIKPKAWAKLALTIQLISKSKTIEFHAHKRQINQQKFDDRFIIYFD